MYFVLDSRESINLITLRNFRLLLKNGWLRVKKEVETEFMPVYGNELSD